MAFVLAGLGGATEVAAGDPAPHSEAAPGGAGAGSPAAAAGANGGEPKVDLSEVIEIWDERPDKPFDRDTELRLTGDDLARRGATTLAEALDLLPDLVVREAGRGGRQLDIRGARKGSIKIIVDGVAIDDPFYGNFDLSSIPVTDIVQIRVSTAPSSPLDGAGGPGGVVEVHTRDAIGPRLVLARATGDTLPTATLASTTRFALGEGLAARLSVTGTLGSRSLPAGPMLELEDDRHALGGALRLEYRKGKRRLVADGWLQDRAFVVPPGEDNSAEFLAIDGEGSQRVGLGYDDERGGWRLQSRLYAHRLARLSSYYSDPELTLRTRSEDIAATRIGAAAIVNRPFRQRFQLIAAAVLDRESAEVTGFADELTSGHSTVGELALGLQYEQGPLRLDSAAGVAVPIGTGADPWLEFKTAAIFTPNPFARFKLTVARKGRLPTLRERFRGDIGNEALGPEHAWFAELSAETTPSRWLSLEVAGYDRASTGIIRFDATQSMLVNTGHLDVRGLDARFKLGGERKLRAGGSFGFTDAYSEESGLDPLDFLPQRRADGWLGWFAGRIQGLVRARYVGRQIDRNAVLGAYVSLDATANAALRENLSLAVRVENLLDERYLVRKAVPGPGLVAFVSLSAAWE